MNARILRIIMLIIMLLLLIGGISGFVFVINMLEQYATQTSKLEAKANAGEINISKLRSLEARLITEQTNVAKAHSIVAESQTYQYQNEVIDDLNEYANESNVSIIGYSFNTSAEAPSSSTPATGNSSTLTPGSSSTLPSGIKATSVTITLESPMPYSRALQFIQQIEQNVTKMQIEGVSLGRANADDPNDDKVELPSLQIQVYIR